MPAKSDLPSHIPVYAPLMDILYPNWRELPEKEQKQKQKQNRSYLCKFYCTDFRPRPDYCAPHRFKGGGGKTPAIPVERFCDLLQAIAAKPSKAEWIARYMDSQEYKTLCAVLGFDLPPSTTPLCADPDACKARMPAKCDPMMTIIGKAKLNFAHSYEKMARDLGWPCSPEAIEKAWQALPWRSGDKDAPTRYKWCHKAFAQQAKKAATVRAIFDSAVLPVALDYADPVTGTRGVLYAPTPDSEVWDGRSSGKPDPILTVGEYVAVGHFVDPFLVEQARWSRNLIERWVGRYCKIGRDPVLHSVRRAYFGGGPNGDRVYLECVWRRIDTVLEEPLYSYGDAVGNARCRPLDQDLASYFDLGAQGEPASRCTLLLLGYARSVGQPDASHRRHTAAVVGQFRDSLRQAFAESIRRAVPLAGETVTVDDIAAVHFFVCYAAEIGLWVLYDLTTKKPTVDRSGWAETVARTLSVIEEVYGEAGRIEIDHDQLKQRLNDGKPDVLQVKLDMRRHVSDFIDRCPAVGRYVPEVPRDSTDLRQVFAELRQPHGPL